MSDNPVAANYTGLAAVWPDVVPPLTFAEAKVAARKLFRLAGVRPPKKIAETSGKRHSWVRWRPVRGPISVSERVLLLNPSKGWKELSERVLLLNPSKGWKELVHDLSHYCFRKLEPNAAGHSEAHADLERRMANEVILRDWINGRLKPEPQPVTVRDRLAERAAHAAKMLARAETRLKRAETIAKKWAARVRYYSKREQR